MGERDYKHNKKITKIKKKRSNFITKYETKKKNNYNTITERKETTAAILQ